MARCTNNDTTTESSKKYLRAKPTGGVTLLRDSSGERAMIYISIKCPNQRGAYIMTRSRDCASAGNQQNQRRPSGWL
jgi:hypothetical protein